MNVLFIGDIHGNDYWEHLCKEALKSFYDIVFLGDYVDSFYISTVEQIHNLKNIIAFKKKYPEKVTLLLGNHDYAYIHDFYCSGKQDVHAHEYKKLFDDNIELFDIAVGYTHSKTREYTLVTHAGLTYSWWNYNVVPMFENEKSILRELWKNPIARPIHEILNALKDKKYTMWKVGPRRGGGSHPGPLWADFHEVIDDPFPSINQIYGHTPGIAPRFIKNEEFAHICVDNWGNEKIFSVLVDV